MSCRVSEAATRGALRVRGRVLPWGERTYLMGIVNVSPDSFSGDGALELPAVLERIAVQRDAGSDIVDIGAESTRPGFVPVDEAEEWARLEPVLARLAEATDLPSLKAGSIQPIPVVIPEVTIEATAIRVILSIRLRLYVLIMGLGLIMGFATAAAI